MLPDKSIRMDFTGTSLKYSLGDEIKVNETDFSADIKAFFNQITRKYV